MGGADPKSLISGPPLVAQKHRKDRQSIDNYWFRKENHQNLLFLFLALGGGPKVKTFAPRMQQV